MPVLTKGETFAIQCDSGYEPIFGRGRDLMIFNNANTNTSSSSFLGVSYARTQGDEKFFTGRSTFAVEDYEVFGLHA